MRELRPRASRSARGATAVALAALVLAGSSAAADAAQTQTAADAMPAHPAADAARAHPAADAARAHAAADAARVHTAADAARAHPAAAGTISTVAGGVGGPARATGVAVATPCGVAFGGGSLYIANGPVRQVDPATDHLTTPAGDGEPGPLGDGGKATTASTAACATALDRQGNLVIADTFDSRVRVVAASTATFYGRAMTAGHIYTIAGTGTKGFSGDGGPATAAKLSFPEGVAVDAAGNVVISDTDNSRVRVLAASTGNFYGQAMSAGDIYTIAGNGASGFSGDGGPATAAQLGTPSKLAIDPAGNLLIAAKGNNRIRVVAASTGNFYGQAMTAGDIYTIAGNGTQGFSGDGGPAIGAELGLPQGVAVDGAGNVLIADTHNDRVRVVAETTGAFYGQAMTAGNIYTIAGSGTRGFSGDGGPATSAGVGAVLAVTVDATGNVVLADSGSRRVRAVAASAGTFYGQAMTAGNIYTIAGNGQIAFSGDHAPTMHAQLQFPSAMAVDSAGDELIADQDNNRIRIVPASTGTRYGQDMTAGNIYTIAGNGASGFSGDGGPGTKAKLRRTEGVAVDAAGNVVISDGENNRIRMVAAHTGTFFGQAMTTGDIYTIAGTKDGHFSGDGGPATKAGLTSVGLAVDAAGNVLLADTGNDRIRVIAASTGTFYGQAMTTGDIYTIAGNGTSESSQDGIPATSAALQAPRGVALDGAGNVLLTDGARVRVVAESTSTFYGQAMTAGDIYTIAGTGFAGFSGDGGPATMAELDFPASVAADPAGNVVIADLMNGRIRVVAAGTGSCYGVPMTAGTSTRSPATAPRASPATVARPARPRSASRRAWR